MKQQCGSSNSKTKSLKTTNARWRLEYFWSQPQLPMPPPPPPAPARAANANLNANTHVHTFTTWPSCRRWNVEIVFRSSFLPSGGWYSKVSFSTSRLRRAYGKSKGTRKRPHRDIRAHKHGCGPDAAFDSHNPLPLPHSRFHRHVPTRTTVGRMLLLGSAVGAACGVQVPPSALVCVVGGACGCT